MLLYYRFSSEHAGSYRECPLSCSALSLAEAKFLLANQCGLASEYLRKIDFRIFLAEHGSGRNTNDAPGSSVGDENLTEVYDENQIIQAFSKLVIQRVSLAAERSGLSTHTAKTNLSQEEWSDDTKKVGAKLKPLPPEWLCGLCHKVMSQPVLVKCVGNCVQSACRACLEASLRLARSCPFCRSAFRQVIRNKRLEEIINHARLDEFELPERLGVAEHTDAAGTITGHRKRMFPSSSATSEGDVSESQFKKPNRESVLRAVQSNAEAMGGVADNQLLSQLEVETKHQRIHFVYLLPQENLQLMRSHDMILVEQGSNLAAALACESREEEIATGDVEGRAYAGKGQSSVLSSTDSLGGRNVYVLPLCASGGGTSFSVGGFVRINSNNRVDYSVDRMAENMFRQWNCPVSGGAHGSKTATIYRVNWLEKYGIMPILPSRKQPLCGLVGTRWRAASGSGHNANPAGLVTRHIFGNTVEVVLEPAKYEEVQNGIRDYAQFGSRPNESWQHSAAGGGSGGSSALNSTLPLTGTTAGQSSSPLASKQQTLLSAASLGKDKNISFPLVPPPPPPPPPALPSHAETSPQDIMSASSSENKMESIETPTIASLANASENAAPPQGIPISLGPPCLGLNGEPGELSNPYIGYCALLPFLTKEQFSHVRLLQRKAVKLCRIRGLEKPTTRMEGKHLWEFEKRAKHWRSPQRYKEARIAERSSSSSGDNSSGKDNSGEVALHLQKVFESSCSNDATNAGSPHAENCYIEPPSRAAKIQSETVAFLPKSSRAGGRLAKDKLLPVVPPPLSTKMTPLSGNISATVIEKVRPAVFA